MFLFLAGAVGGAPIAVTVGIMCDIYNDPRERELQWLCLCW
jgi:hypothetical protein